VALPSRTMVNQQGRLSEVKLTFLQLSCTTEPGA
jgi:hypothetical protein